MYKKLKIWALSLALVIAIVGFEGTRNNVYAQAGATTSNIVGRVFDSQSLAIMGAKIVVKNVDTNFSQSVSSNEDGSFRLQQLPPGTYEVTVMADGFTQQAKMTILRVGGTVAVDFELGVEDVAANEVTIEAGFSGGIADGGAVLPPIEEERIERLPINRRNFLDFTLTSPRATLDRLPPNGNTATSGISFNGQTARGNNITIDGFNNNDLQTGGVRSAFSQEAVQEFQIVSDGFSAEFGRALGGVINIVTKGGTNKFNGTVFGFARNDELSARDTFATTEPNFEQYQFGATLSGPIKKDRAFFFTSFERQTVKQNDVVTIPQDLVSAAQRVGVPVASGTVPFSVGLSTFLARTDLQLTSNDRLTARYNGTFRYDGGFETILDQRGGLISSTTTGIQRLDDNTLSFNNLYIRGANLVNETRFLITRRDQDVTTPVDGQTVGFLIPQGLSVLGRNIFLPARREEEFYQFVNNVSLSRGRQSIKFGVDFNYSKYPDFFLSSNLGGTSIFAPLPLSQLGGVDFTVLEAFDPSLRNAAQRQFLTAFAMQLPALVAGFPRNLPLADLPLPANFQQRFGLTTSEIDAKFFSGFVQDDIRLKPNLLLSLGVRYDINRVETFPGTDGAISPRFALAYTPSRLSRLTVRISSGLFYGVPSLNLASVFDSAKNQINVNLPFPQSLFVLGQPGRIFGNIKDVPQAFLAPQLGLARVTQPNLDDSYTQQTNLSLSYAIDKASNINVTYSYVRGINLSGVREINPIVRPIANNPMQSALTGRVDPTRGSVVEVQTAFDSYFHGVTVLYNRRFTNRLGVQANYTYSKAIDTVSDNIRDDIQTFNNSLDIGSERGLSLNDVRNRFLISSVWRLDYTKNPFLKDFQLSTILRLESGRPYNLTAGVDVNMDGDGGLGDRPNGIGRNTGISPGFANLDLRLTRSLTVKENYRIQIFAEIFNLFNRVNISQFSRVFPPDSKGNFNLPRQAGGRFTVPRENFLNAFAPRQCQFGFRLTF
jgi:Carboxypeptidase regulatory-like domain